MSNTWMKIDAEVGILRKHASGGTKYGGSLQNANSYLYQSEKRPAVCFDT